MFLGVPFGGMAVAVRVAAQGGLVGAGSSGATESMTTGLVVLGLLALVQLGTGILAMFVTRREVELHGKNYDRRQQDAERRLAALEEVEPATPADIAQIRAEAATARNDFLREVAVLHEKVNRVDRALSSVETETRLQTGTLRAIAGRLGIAEIPQ